MDDELSKSIDEAIAIIDDCLENWDDSKVISDEDADEICNMLDSMTGALDTATEALTEDIEKYPNPMVLLKKTNTRIIEK